MTLTPLTRTLLAGLPYGLQLKLEPKVVWRPNLGSRPKGKGSDATLTVDLLADIINGTFDPMAKFKPILYSLETLTEEWLESKEFNWAISNFEELKAQPMRYPYVIVEDLARLHVNSFNLQPGEYIAVTNENNPYL